MRLILAFLHHRIDIVLACTISFISPSHSNFAQRHEKKAVKIPSIIKNPGNKKMAGTGDIMIQLFSCCIQSQPSPTRRRHHQRLRIDRSMIGNPTNFVHTGKATNKVVFWLNFKATISKCFAGHIGSNDAELSSQHLTVIQSQMQSKGGYDINSLRMQVCGWKLQLPCNYLIFFLSFHSRRADKRFRI